MTGKYLLLGLFGILTCFLGGTVGREAIVNGYPVVRAGQFPYQVSVQNQNHKHICGGGAISRIYVLTAGNCVMMNNYRFIRGPIYILAGTFILTSILPSAETIQVKRIYIPKEENPSGQVADIVILQLQYGLKASAKVNAFLKLPSREFHGDLNNTYAVIAGYGWNTIANATRDYSDDNRLQYAQFRILVGKACEQTYTPGIVNSERHICARIDETRPQRELHSGVVKGDEGGPLVQGHTYHPTVVGILVKASPFCNERNDRGYPGIYARVAYYREFIKDVLEGTNSTNIRIHFPRA